MKPVRPPDAPSLRHNYLSSIEDAAQALGGMAPTGTMGVILPLLIARGGNASWLSFLFILVAFSLIFFCVNRFAQHFASAGSFATYAEESLGATAGAIAGWAYVLAMCYGMSGTAPSAAYYADVFITEVTGAHGSLLRGAWLIAAVIVASWLIAFRDMKLSTIIMLAIEFVTLAVMLAVIALAMFRTGAWIDSPQIHLQGATISGFQLAMVFGFMTLAGFETVTTLGEESTRATRTIPRVIIASLVPVGLLYLAMTYCLVALARKYGLDMSSLDAPFDAIARAMHFARLGYLSSLGIALSYFVCTLAQLNAGARVLYHMAQKNMFAAKFGVAHPTNHTPHRAIALLAIVALALPLALLASRVSLVDVVNYVTQLASYGFIASYFMACFALPFYLHRKGALRFADAAISAGAMIILGVVLILGFFPVPAAPYRYLPYAFLLSAAAGIAVSLHYLRRHYAQ
jgi:amino acid transporter